MARCLLQNRAHNAELSSWLADSLRSAAHADVVFHCSDQREVRAHAIVLAAVSPDLFGKILATGASLYPEEDLHVTLAETSSVVANIIVKFAYSGEALLPKTLVEAVSDAALRLRIKFLKDSFVRISQKEYQAIKEGKKTFKSVAGATAMAPTAMPPTAAVSASIKAPPVATNSASTATTTTTSAASPGKRQAPKKKSPKEKKNEKSDSDTDSADDDEKREAEKKGAASVAAPAKGKRSRAPTKRNAAVQKKDPQSVVFTLTKQVEDSSTKAVTEDRAYMVHFKPAGPSAQPVTLAPKPSAPPPVQPMSPVKMAAAGSVIRPRVPAAAPRVIAPVPTALSKPIPPNLLPTAPLQVRKVMIPPVVKKPTVGAPAKPAGAAHASDAFLVTTIVQPDGTEIKVLKPPSGHIMKQLNSTKSAPPSKVSSNDAVAVAMGALSKAPASVVAKGGSPRQVIVTLGAPAGGGAPVPILLSPPTKTSAGVIKMTPVQTMPGYGRSKLPTTVALPTSPLPLSVVQTTTKAKAKAAGTPVRVVASPQQTLAPTQQALLQPHLYALAPASHSLSQPKPGIPSTLPDDFLVTDDNEAQSKNGEKTASGGRGRKTLVKAKPATPVKADASTRSSGRMRKVNKKYTEAGSEGAADSSESEGDKKKEDSVSSAGAGRKRKQPTPADDSDSAGPPNKKAAPAKAEVKAKSRDSKARVVSAAPRGKSSNSKVQVQKPEPPSRASTKRSVASAGRASASGPEQTSKRLRSRR